LLEGAVIWAAAVLAAVALRLVGLLAAVPGFVSDLADLAHVVTILNHEWTTEAFCLVFLL
jgi:hypothetical protein